MNPETGNRNPGLLEYGGVTSYVRLGLHTSLKIMAALTLLLVSWEFEVLQNLLKVILLVTRSAGNQNCKQAYIVY